jgi:hypothetical protein
MSILGFIQDGGRGLASATSTAIIVAAENKSTETSANVACCFITAPTIQPQLSLKSVLVKIS